MNGEEDPPNYVGIKVSVQYAPDYPSVGSCHLCLEEPKNLSSDLITELKQQLSELVKEAMCSQVVVLLDLYFTAIRFLEEHNKPPLSLYEDMMHRQQKEEEIQKQEHMRIMEIEKEKEKEAERKTKALQKMVKGKLSSSAGTAPSKFSRHVPVAGWFQFAFFFDRIVSA